MFLPNMGIGSVLMIRLNNRVDYLMLCSILSLRSVSESRRCCWDWFKFPNITCSRLNRLYYYYYRYRVSLSWSGCVRQPICFDNLFLLLIVWPIKCLKLARHDTEDQYRHYLKKNNHSRLVGRSLTCLINWSGLIVIGGCCACRVWRSDVWSDVSCSSLMSSKNWEHVFEFTSLTWW